jgi:PAS domain S-box-containing protein
MQHFFFFAVITNLENGLLKGHCVDYALGQRVRNRVKETHPTGDDGRPSRNSLAQSEAMFRALFENATDGIILADAETSRFIRCNRTMRKMLGYGGDKDISQLRVSDIHPKEHLPDVLEQFERKAAGGVGPAKEIPVLRSDGTVFYADVNAARIMIDGKDCVVRMFRDVSDRKYIEEQLRNERDRAQICLDVAEVVFVAIDGDGLVYLINRKGCEILGYEENEIVGKNWFDNFIPERTRAALLGVAHKLLTGNAGAAMHCENPVLTKSGEERIIAWHNTVIRDENGNITGHLSSGEDITEFRRLERLLAEISREEREKLRHELHDGVCQHLTGIRLLSNILKKDLAAAGSELEANADAISRMAEETIERSQHIATALVPLSGKPTALSDALADLASHTGALYRIQCHYTPVPAVRIADREVSTQIYRIAREAVTNAIRHGAPTRILLRLSEIDGTVKLDVSNNGTPFPDQLPAEAGIGIEIMKYRANLVGARLAVGRKDNGSGTLVRVEWRQH